MNALLKLDEEYRSTRAALVDAGINMTDSIDALYRDWRRWREKTSRESVGIANADRWWALHLAQFRSLIDPLRVAARAERVRKDSQSAEPVKPHPA